MEKLGSLGEPAVEDEHPDKISIDLSNGQVEIKSSSSANTDCPVEHMLNGHEGLWLNGTHKYCCEVDHDNELKLTFNFKRPVKFATYSI
jgi:hypothetical protein